MNAAGAAPIFMRLRCVLSVVLFVAIGAGFAQQRMSSGPGRTHLIELYTSEGCSSCPPAERWLGTLRGHPGLWRDFVPVAFHVNYWDRLGWRDRFASREFTARQYAYADAWRARTVYTPGFVLDGAEWRIRSLSRREPPAREDEPAGMLTVELDNDGGCRVEYATAQGTKPGDFEAHVALLGGDVSSKVTAGENDGRTLEHEFVALALASARLNGGASTVRLPASNLDGVGRRAIAVWVTRAGELTPLQATGGWLSTVTARQPTK